MQKQEEIMTTTEDLPKACKCKRETDMQHNWLKIHHANASAVSEQSQHRILET